MMAATDARRVQAQQALQRAVDGELYDGGEYPLCITSTGRFKTNLPKQAMANLNVSDGKDGQVYIDLQHNAVVICYGDD